MSSKDWWLNWFRALRKSQKHSSYRAEAVSLLWRISLCRPAGFYQSFYSFPPQLCPRRWSCSPFSLSNNFFSVGLGFQQLMSWRETPSNSPRVGASRSFPAEEKRTEGKRRWHRRLVCPTTNPQVWCWAHTASVQTLLSVQALKYGTVSEKRCFKQIVSNLSAV